MKNFDKVLAFQERNMKYNPWFERCDDFYYYFAILNELDEAKNELMNYDCRKLEDEMGDVLWTTLNLIAKLESRWYIDSWRMIDGLCEKLSERMPYVVDGKPEIDPDVRTKLWNEAKARQKARMK